MPRPYRLYLEDILTAAGKIQDYTKALDFDDFKKNSMAVDAVLRNLEVIGEASKKIPRLIRTRYPDVEWKKIAGLRDIIIHEYFGLNMQILWDIITRKVPTLQNQIERILLEAKKGDLPFQR